MSDIHTTIDGAEHTLANPIHQNVATILEELGKSSQTGCTNQGSCGSCLIMVKGKPRLSCTLRAKNLHGKPVETIDGLSSSFQHRLTQAFEHAGTIQCAYCLPGIIRQIGILQQYSPQPTHEEIRKALNTHSCRCTSYDQLVHAIYDALSSSTLQHDGWEPTLSTAAATGQRPRVSQISVPNLQYVRLVFASNVNVRLTGIEAPPDITFISHNTHPTCSFLTPEDSILTRTSLLGFIVADSKWEAEEALQRVVIHTGTEDLKADETKTNVVDWTIAPIEQGALETECCVIHNQHLFVNGITACLANYTDDYTVHNWSVGGHFGTRTFTQHIEWAQWCAEELNMPIHLELSMSDAIRLRPKSPPVKLSITPDEAASHLLQVQTVSGMTDWTSQLQRFIHTQVKDILGLSINIEILPTVDTVWQHTPSRLAIELALGWIWFHLSEIQQNDVLTQRIAWLNQVTVQHPHLKAFSNGFTQHAERWATFSNVDNRLGWGVGYTPAQEIRLDKPLTIQFQMLPDQTCQITWPFADAEGALTSIAIQLLHLTTGLPKEHMRIHVSGHNPMPDWDVEAIRPMLQQTLQEMGQHIQAVLSKEGLHALQTPIMHTQQTWTLAGNACSVLLELTPKGKIEDAFILMDTGWTPSFSQATANISGLWMRALGAGFVPTTFQEVPHLYRALNLPKAKDIPDTKLELTHHATVSLSWSSIQAATTMAILHARAQLGLAHQEMPFSR